MSCGPSHPDPYIYIIITPETGGIYAVCASVESQIYSQCNIYKAGQKKVAFKYLTEKVFKSHLFGSPTIVSTDAEVESMIYGKEVNPDLVQVEKAKAILMEHEVAILEVLAKLADVSDGDGSPKQFQYHDSQKELQRIGRGMATQKDLYVWSG
ncbi:hypothetical protein ACSBR2_027124 [Camellia fascicularis]